MEEFEYIISFVQLQFPKMNHNVEEKPTSPFTHVLNLQTFTFRDFRHLPFVYPTLLVYPSTVDNLYTEVQQVPYVH